MADKSKPAAAEAPALPPSPLIKVPASRLPARAVQTQLVPGIAAPSPQARQARASAVAARGGIEQLMTRARALQTQLKAALAAHDASPEAQAEWQREGVDAGIVHAFNDHLASALDQFTAKK
jgi:hypothetical protein